MIKIILMSFAVIALLVVSIVFFQRQLIYFPSHAAPQLKQWQAEDMQAIQLMTADQLNLTAWYKPAKAGEPTIVYFQGNAGHWGHRVPLIKPYLDQGYGVLLLGYRGYGDNPGTPSEAGLYRDARSAMRFLHLNQVSNPCIFLFGESLGTGVAVQMALEYQVAGVILQTPFTSLVDLARYHYPLLFILPWLDRLLYDHFNSLEKISQIQTPLLIIHGDLDRIVPIKFGRALFEQANEPKQFNQLPNKSHNNLYSHLLFDGVIHFVEQNKNCNRH